MKISIIVAVARNGIIGRDGSLPWRLPADLRWFRRWTMGHPVVMGRRTWESIGRPLPGRTMLVVTHQLDYDAPGCVVVHSLEAALDHARSIGADEVFVIGGASLYAEALPRAETLYLTEVEAHVEGDVAFPDRGPGWREMWRESHPADESQPYAASFVILRRTP